MHLLGHGQQGCGVLGTGGGGSLLGDGGGRGCGSRDGELLHLAFQGVALGVQGTQLNDELVQEVVDLVAVVTGLLGHDLKALRNQVFGGDGHVASPLVRVGFEVECADGATRRERSAPASGAVCRIAQTVVGTHFTIIGPRLRGFCRTDNKICAWRNGPGTRSPGAFAHVRGPLSACIPLNARAPQNVE